MSWSYGIKQHISKVNELQPTYGRWFVVRSEFGGLRKENYLHKDGEWRERTWHDGEWSGYFNTEDEARAALESAILAVK